MKKLLPILLCGVMLTGCATREQYGEEIAPTRRYGDIAATQNYQPQFVVYDPAEGLNKHIYKFNAKLDDYVLIPVVNGYKTVTPEFVRTGVSNFFNNVGEVTNFVNSTLQASPTKAGTTLARFAINTTVGLLGTVDVATRIGLNRQQEDFGKTLGKWGAGDGAYIVLPFFGPSNLRDTTGKIVDLATLSFIIPNHVERNDAYKVVAYGLMPLDARYKNDFRYFESGSPFEYELVRYISTKARDLQVQGQK
jgi:phospholipid-binding lipoprotein MlaA